MLYIVATPIGNLEDITFRAVRTLKEVDTVLAEDTRQTRKIFNRYEISSKLESFHAHSNEARLNKYVDRLKAGETMALVSDAGTPGICDPGFKLIKEALAVGVEVSPIPGPSALTACVSVSGFPMHNFLFLGFLPIKKGRKTLFESLKDCPYTVVFYESVHRIEKTIKQLIEFGLEDREICLGREVTKKFETFYRGKLSALPEKDLALKGEFCFVLGPPKFSLEAKPKIT